MAAGGLHVVLGAGGGIGGAVTRELAAQGRRVRAVGRSVPAGLPETVEPLTADVATTEGAEAACEGAEVVFHCAQPAYDRWMTEFPPLNAAITGACARAGARLVFADNLYMYGPIGGPISEQTPTRPRSRKGAVRLALAEALLEAHAEGRVQVTVGRASDYFGPGGIGSVGGDLLFGAATEGRTVRWPGDPDLPHALSYLPDVARALVMLAGAEEAYGAAWILPAAPALSARAFCALVGEALGRPVTVKGTGRLSMRVAGLFIPEAREMPDVMYQFTDVWDVDASVFLARIGTLEATPHRVAVAETLAWWRQRSAPGPA